MNDWTTQDGSASSTDSVGAIGAVGVGNMGEPILQRIAPSFETIAFDRDADRLAAVAGDGVCAADSLREIGDREDVVLFLLPSSEAVEAVTLNDDGVLAGLSTRDVLIDTSTIEPDVTEAVASTCGDRDITFLDIPVSDGPRNRFRRRSLR